MPAAARSVFDWFASFSLPGWIAFSLAGNVAIFLGSVALCAWRAGWIRITHPAWWRTILDLFIFVGLMDLGMYLSHRLAHHPRFYGRIHARPHAHESVNPLSLFVLHPLEVAGFGGLMIGVLMLVPLSGAAVLAYLTLNVLFGTLGHAGVEPFPASWARLPVVAELGSSSFHAAHHRTPGVNFGFSTRLWDRLFGTLARDRRR